MAHDGGAAVEQLRARPYDFVLLDLQIPRLDGIGVLRAVPQLRTTVVMLSGFLDINTTLEALRHGAVDVLEKPVSFSELLKLAEDAVEHPPTEVDDGGEVHEVVGRSAAAIQLRCNVRRIARHPDVPVLVVGETGTGKEVVARAIHRMSGRPGEMVAINCAAVPDGLFESLLFGHEGGSFTGATKDSRGLFEAAMGGTVFLDEVGEMPAQQQAKLLRVLETRTFRRVGETRERPLKARIISATNRDLRGRSGEALRPDLYFRLAGFTVRTPRLFERAEDIEALILQFLRELGPHSPRRVSRAALEALQAYDWPGNARELRSLSHSAALRCSGDLLSLRAVAEALEERGAFLDAPAPGDVPAVGLRGAEAELIQRALDVAHGNMSQAARALRIPRSTLRDKVKRYGLG